MPFPFFSWRKIVKREDYEQVRSLREAGYSYSQIATVLEVPKNSVKSYCNRFGIRLGTEDVNSDGDNALHCKQCGRVMEYDHQSARRRFCSNECRMRWWNAHRHLVNSKVSQKTVCANCGKVFRSYPGEHRKYCCNGCYIEDRFRSGNTNDK